MNVKQVGGICGALLTNLTAWLSGVWFDVSLVGGVFEKIANLLPFIHAVKLGRAIISGAPVALPSILITLGYGAAIMVAAVILFFRQMKKR